MLILLPQPSDANMRLCGFKLTTTLKAICKNQVCGGHLLEKQKSKSTFYFVTFNLCMF